MNNQDFTSAIEAFAAKAQQAIVDMVRAAVVGIFSDIVQRTPVDTGRLRASWRIGIGSPDLSCEGPGRFSPNAAMGQTSKMNDFGPGDIGLPVFISNSVDYAVYVEFGTSRQAPAGMVVTTLRAWQGHGLVGLKVSVE